MSTGSAFCNAIQNTDLKYLCNLLAPALPEIESDYQALTYNLSNILYTDIKDFYLRTVIYIVLFVVLAFIISILVIFFLLANDRYKQTNAWYPSLLILVILILAAITVLMLV